MIRINFKKILLVSAVLTASLFISCKTSKVTEFSPEMTEVEIIQTAQDLYEKGYPELAVQCYQQLIQRYGMNTATYIEGSFEMAHILIKLKQYEPAYQKLTEIIEMYTDAAPGSLPGAYKKLAEIDLKKIPEEFKTVKGVDLEVSVE